jgi:predicted nuclease of restriction endonuclease-like (RecB) superfamily
MVEAFASALPCKSDEKKEFYLLSATGARCSHRELERQLKKSTFERTMLSQLKLATAHTRLDLTLEDVCIVQNALNEVLQRA